MHPLALRIAKYRRSSEKNSAGIHITFPTLAITLLACAKQGDSCTPSVSYTHWKTYTAVEVFLYRKNIRILPSEAHLSFSDLDEHWSNHPNYAGSGQYIDRKTVARMIKILKQEEKTSSPQKEATA